MSDLIARTAKLQPRPKRVKAVPSFATTYWFEAEEHPNLGSLYVVIEVLTNQKQAQAVADLIIETTGEAYYNEQDHSENVLKRFEAAIKATNRALSDYTEKGNAGWVGRISAIVAIVAGDELHLTQTGSAEAYLYRGSRVSHITQDLQPGGPQRPITTFGNIASGQLQLHDRLVMATPALLHQVANNDLKDIIENSTANGAITKLSQLVNDQDDADRAAAIVVEVANTEVLAMQTRPDEPDEVSVGQADKPLELAKSIAAPAVDSLVQTSRSVGTKAVEHTRTRLLPALKSGLLMVVSQLRHWLSKPRGRQVAVGIMIALALGIGWSMVSSNQAHRFDAALKEYEQLYADYEKAGQLQVEGDKQTARSTLVSVQSGLEKLAKTPGRGEFDKKLATRPHPEADPASIDKLSTLVQAELDRLDGLFKVAGIELGDLSKIEGAASPKNPHHVELVGNKLFIFDDSEANFYQFDLTSKVLSAGTLPAGSGKVVATAVASGGNGVFALTNKPAVLLVNNDGATEQSVAFGEWPKGRAIASYTGNLYILADDGSQVYKHVPTTGGFAGKTNFFSTALLPEVAGSTSLAVDGYLYTAGPYGIKRFVQGALDTSNKDLPETLRSPADLRSIVDGGILVIRDTNSQRLAIFNPTNDAVGLGKQVQVTDLKAVTAMTTDSTGKTAYVVADGKLWSVSLP
jgi:serine/threonine protein phosphatase PrpC